MYIAIAIIILILCVLLSVVILVQNPKGGGLTQSLGGVSTQVFGAKNSNDLVDKVTWGLAISIVVLSILSTAFITKGTGTNEIQKSDAEELMNEAPTNLPSNTEILTTPENQGVQETAPETQE